MRPFIALILCLSCQFLSAQTFVVDTVNLNCPEDQFLVLPANQTSLPVDLFAPEANACPPDSLSYTLTGATEVSGAGWAGTQNLNRGVTEVTYTGCEQASFANFLGDAAYLPDGTGADFMLPLNATGFEAVETVAGAGGLVSVCADLEHSFVGDLDIWLVCPNGSRVSLLDYVPSDELAGQRFGGGSRDTDTPDPTAWYCWTLAGSQTLVEIVLTDSLIMGDSIPAGDYLPDGDFADLADCPVNGEWTLNFRDNLFEDNGHVSAWTLTFGNASVKTCSYTVTVEQEECDLLLTGAAITDTICAGEAFTWLGTIYDTTGVYTDTIASVFGCDSLVTLNLVVQPDTDDCSDEQGELTGTIFRIDANGMPQPLPYTRLAAGDARDTAALDGTYRLDGLPLNVDYTIEPSLDVDHRNGISIIDVLIMRGIILGGDILPLPTLPYPYIAADVNGDCEIDVRDLVGLLRVYTGRTDRFSGVDSYRFLPADYEFSEVCGVPAAIELMLVDATFGGNDFIGIKTGDLNLSAGTPDPEGIVPFGFPDQQFLAGEHVEVTLRPGEGLVAADLFWRFDERMLEPVADNAFTHTDGEKMHQVWTDLAGAPVLSFTARADGNLTDALWLTQDSRGVDAAAHVFSLERVAEEVTEFRLMAYPNPFREELSVAISSAKSGLAELMVVDMTGREVLRRSLTLAQGTEEIRIAAGNWSAGVYQVIVVAGGERENVKVVRF